MIKLTCDDVLTIYRYINHDYIEGNNDYARVFFYNNYNNEILYIPRECTEEERRKRVQEILDYFNGNNKISIDLWIANSNNECLIKVNLSGLTWYRVNSKNIVFYIRSLQSIIYNVDFLSFDEQNTMVSKGIKLINKEVNEK